MPSDTQNAGPSSVIIPVRPASNQSRSSRAAEIFDTANAKPLGVRRVFTQVSHDLYGTKDVQDIITASYVWMADQIGHLFLGLVPTLLLAWLAAWIVPAGWFREAVTILLALAIFGYWGYKEATDFHDTKLRAGKVFPFDSSDILWNVKTALTYFGIGGIWAVAAFTHGWLLLVAILISAWPGLMVAYWWLRRKLAFQQAGLPYLYRLANFKTVCEPHIVETIGEIANLKERKVVLWRVLFGIDRIPKRRAAIRHLLITGPMGAGKTSLAVGIGTEWAFALGLGRYMSATAFVQTVAASTGPANQMEYADGRVLWPYRESELVIVDDLDACVTRPDGSTTNLIQPSAFVDALTADGPQTLHWLGHRRSVWVVGECTNAGAWKTAIAGLIGVGEGEILEVDLTLKP